MALPNVKIILGNGNLKQVAATDDGISGLIMTGTAVAGKLELNKAYMLGSMRDLQSLGVTAENNPLAYKDVAAFYAQAGEGSELYILVVSEATTLTQMCSIGEDSPLRKLINASSGRIRLVGLNKNPGASYIPVLTQAMDEDAVSAGLLAQQVAEEYFSMVRPFRVLLPAIAWTGETEDLFAPRECSYNRVGYILASDGQYGTGKYYSAAIGQVLGRAASISVHRSLGRVRDGVVAASGWLTNGKTPEENFSKLSLLHDAGFIFYRTLVGKNGYYLNGDAMAAPLSDDYNSLNLGRVIDKATVIAYTTYIDDLLDNVEVDDEGKLPVPVCKDFEGTIRNAVLSLMAGEISSFEAYVSPDQNILSTSSLAVSCKIVPLGVLREINVNLSFSNPTV